MEASTPTRDPGVRTSRDALARKLPDRTAPESKSKTDSLSHTRYPGARSFRDDDLDRKIFYGRSSEKDTLLHLILAEDLVVLYARSGTGKTSLLNAGVLQGLRDEDYLPLMVRLNDPTAGPFKTLYEGIEEAARRQGVEYVKGEQASLWHFFKTMELWREDTLLTPVLILDQFEELFTLQSQENRNAFIEQFAHLVRGNAPRGANGEPAQHLSDASPALKVLLSIREDFLGNLEDLAHKVPHILHTRFRLGPLSPADARQAIEKPAQIVDAQITTPRFEYTAGTVDKILKFLCQRRVRETMVPSEEVEPFQLQLICQHVESIVGSRQATNDSNLTIDYEEDLAGDDGLRGMLKHFYDAQIEELAPVYGKKSLFRLCEEGLISSHGRRLSLEEGEIERQFKIPPPALLQLVDRRLLRAEPRLGSKFYELSHDTLVDPILESRKKRTRSRRIRNAGISAALVFLILGGWAWKEFRANYKNKIEEDAKRVAELLPNDPEAALFLAVDAAGRSASLHGQPSADVSYSLARAVEEARSLSTLDLHGWKPTDSLLSPRGDMVAVGTREGKVLFLDTAGRLLRATDPLGRGPIRSLASSSDGEHIAAVAENGTLRIWDWTGRPLGKLLKSPTRAVRRLAVQPGGRLLALADDKGKLFLLDSAGRQVGEAQTSLGGPLISLAFSPEGDELASLQSDHAVGRWKVSPAGLEKAESIPPPAQGFYWTATTDGNRVLAEADGRVWLWDLKAAERHPAGKLSQLKNEGKDVSAVALSGDGRELAVGYRNGEIEIRSADDYRIMTTLVPQQDGTDSQDRLSRLFSRRTRSTVSVLAFAPDGRHLASGDLGGDVRLWELANRKPVFVGGEEKRHRGIVRDLAFHPDGDKFVTVSDDSTLRLWSLGGKLLHVYKRRGKPPVQELSMDIANFVLTVAIDPQGIYMVSGDGSGRLETWDFNGRLLELREGERVPITNLDLDPTGERILASYLDGAVRVWQTEKGRHIRPLEPLDGSPSASKGPPYARFYDKGGKIWRATPDGTLAWFDAQKLTFKGANPPLTGITALAYSPDGTKLMMGTASGGLMAVPRHSSGKPDEFLSPTSLLVARGAHVAEISALAFTPDGRLLSGGSDGTLRLWMADGTPIEDSIKQHKDAVRSTAFTPEGRILSLDANQSLVMSESSAPEDGPPAPAGNALAVDPRGRYFATLSTQSTEHELAVWDLKTGRKLRGISNPGCEAPSSLAASHDGTRLAMGCEDGRIKFFTPVLSGLPDAIEKLESPVRALAFDPQGRFFITGDDVGMLKLWTLEGRAKGKGWKAHPGGVLAVDISDDGRWIASGGKDSKVKIWPAESDPSQARFERAHLARGGVNSVAFSPDGTHLASGGDDRTVRIWGWLEDRNESQREVMHVDRISSLAFSPDGERLLTATFDGRMYLWDLEKNPLAPPLGDRPQSEDTDSEEKEAVMEPDSNREDLSTGPGPQVAFTADGKTILSSAAQSRKGDWRSWLEAGCERLRFHARMQKPDSDSAWRVRRTCERFAWGGEGNATPLETAAHLGDAASVRKQARRRSRLDAANGQGDRPLHIAIKSGSTVTVAALLEAGADPNTPDSRGTPPLDESVRTGAFTVTLELLARGADPRRADSFGQTPLHYAAMRGDLEMVKLLLAHGAGPGRADRQGVTPLMNAAYGGHTPIIKTLLDAGVNINAQDIAGNTALIEAAKKGFLEVVELLHGRGADINLENRNHTRRTALLWAKANGHDEVAEFLTSKQPRLTQPLPSTSRIHLRRYIPARFLPFAEVEEIVAWQPVYGPGKVSVQTFRSIQQRAEKGDSFAQLLIGRAYLEGIGVPPDSVKALGWLEKSARQGDPLGQALLGVAYWTGKGMAQDIQKAHEWIERSAEQGNALGRLYLGLMYDDGIYVERIPERALELYRQAAEDGDPVAQNMVGFTLDGLPDEKDLKDAYHFYKLAADNGDLSGQYNAGYMLLFGRGVGRSTQRAREILLSAAHQQSRHAIYMLGQIYAHGIGVPRSDTEATSWFRKSAEAGDSDGQVELAWRLEHGLGEAKSLPEAVEWYHKAAAQGESFAAARLEILGLKP